MGVNGIMGDGGGVVEGKEIVDGHLPLNEAVFHDPN